MLQHLFWYLRLIKTHTSPSTAASRWLSWLENSCQGLGLLQCALRSPTCLGPGLGVGKVRAPDWYAFFFFNVNGPGFGTNIHAGVPGQIDLF